MDQQEGLNIAGAVILDFQLLELWEIDFFSL